MAATPVEVKRHTWRSTRIDMAIGMERTIETQLELAKALTFPEP
jgi:hypothetical protein